MICVSQLRLALKPMLTISENVVSFKVFESMADDTML